ncbi:uncharacterized protein [Miscanthus floridulus]|uniref:uncharacterized protein n=1 Tax=Miscanthus floridulus TaxID=154761 RepID=UPI0034575656
MAERSPNPRALLEYDVFATPDLTASGGFRSLSPPSGFLDAGSGPHFFKVRCLFCGDESKKDVALYALAPGAQGCSERFGSRLLTRRCHPTCPNPAHMVRKCASPDCRELGSIELQEVAGSLRQTGRLRFLTIKCQGYEILIYTAGQEWVAVSATGEVVPVFYGIGKIFKGSDAAGNKVAIPTRFQVVQKE